MEIISRLLLGYGEDVGIILAALGAILLLIGITLGVAIIILGVCVICLELACRFYKQL
jgi:hypothetical protein